MRKKEKREERERTGVRERGELMKRERMKRETGMRERREWEIKKRERANWVKLSDL